MGAASALAGAETHNMVLVHNVFRREFRLLGDLIAAVPDSDTGRAGELAAHAREMIGVLHHHHTAEDELIWPELERRAGIDDALTDRMIDQHERVGRVLDTMGEELRRWAHDAGPISRGQLAANLGELCAALGEHLDDEEHLVLPIVGRTLTLRQWNAVAKRGMRSLPKSRRLIMLGYILEDADSGERGAFLAHVPPPARLAYRLFGRRRFLAETSRLRRPGN
jgi:hemerythrin-like domain-containing protein